MTFASAGLVSRLRPALLAFDTYGAPAGVTVAMLSFVAMGTHAFDHQMWLGAGLGIVGLGAAIGATLRTGSLEQLHATQTVDAAIAECDGLRSENAVLAAAKHECDVILDSVKAYLLVIDPTYRIASRHSPGLETLLGQGDLTDQNLLNVLQRILSDRSFKTARDYLNLLFDATKKERTVLKVNPLDEVELGTTDTEGSRGVRYLKFSFRRIVEAGHIVKVLVSIEDATDQTVIERRLRESEQKKIKQFELLIGILHVSPDDLDGFVTMANQELAAVDAALSATDFAEAADGQSNLLRERLDSVLQRAHNIKGNAMLLGLDHFEKFAQDFERRIVDLKKRQALGGDDFLSIVIDVADMRSDLDDLQVLRSKLVGMQKNVVSRHDSLVQILSDFTQNLANKLGKPVRLDVDGFDSRALSPEHRSLVRDVLIQLTRNSLAHGIESREERFAASKPATATIRIRPIEGLAPSVFGFSFYDDGRGLDAKQIRDRAISAGLLHPERAQSVADSEIASYIFAPGFSTARKATSDAGRGMGMNVVKKRVVDDFGGEIGVSSQAGQFCEFSFVLPEKPIERRRIPRPKAAAR